MVANSTTGSSSYAGSGGSSRSSLSRRARLDQEQHDGGQGDDFVEKRSTLENGIFGVLFTLSKESSEARVRKRWVILKVMLDAWQLFTTVVVPTKYAWSINEDAMVWKIISVINFTWLSDLGYNAYLAILYTMLALLAINVAMCMWVAWCFKENKFPVVWPIKVLRLFSRVFFQAFDVASLNLLQLGISCRFMGRPKPHLHLDLFPEYSCGDLPHIMHALVSALCLVVFVLIAMLINMAEVEVNLLSRKPFALGHSGAEVMCFAIKVLLTLVHVFLGWPRVAASALFVLSLAYAWQYIRWSPHLVAWVNYLKSGVAVSIVWCCCVLMLLVFLPGVKQVQKEAWSETMTITMLAGLLPAFCVGALISRAFIRHMTAVALKALAEAKPDAPLDDICQNLDDPRDVEIVARCCRVWKDRYNLDPDAVAKGRQVIQAGVAMFPNSAYMVLLHANFMIDVLGVNQSGSRRIDDARKLSPSLLCRFIMFIRQQQATQNAACNAHGATTGMDLLAYVEYQRKQRMVVRLHREALQAMCNFWKALDSSRISFTHLSKALGKIESSVSQAQSAYRIVLESYGSNPKLVRLYGRFLQTIKNDPWRASEYFAEAERLEELQGGDARGPVLPDGTPLGRMDELSTAVLVINAVGEVQMANKHAHVLFGYKRGMLEAKPAAMLLAPHFGRKLNEKLEALVNTSAVSKSMKAEEGVIFYDGTVVGMHSDRLAFLVRLSLHRATGVGEDSTFIVMLDAVPPTKGVASLWVSHNGTVVACDPQFGSTFGWKAGEVNGSSITTLVKSPLPPSLGATVLEAPSDAAAVNEAFSEGANNFIRRLLERRCMASTNGGDHGVDCIVMHKYDSKPVACTAMLADKDTDDVPIYEVRIKMVSSHSHLLVVNRKGHVVHASSELATVLRDNTALGRRHGHAPAGGVTNGNAHSRPVGAYGPQGGSGVTPAPNDTALGVSALAGGLLTGYTLFDFLPLPWKDLHLKHLKGTTILTPQGRSPWTCRKGGEQGPTMELRTTSGRAVHMRVSVSTEDIGGELNHVVRLASSTLDAAMSERRLRLRLSEDGRIASISDDTPMQLFGIRYTQLIGLGLWDIIEWSSHRESGALPSSGPLMFTFLIKTALATPGLSWRVQVVPPAAQARPCAKTASGAGTALDIIAAARNSLAIPAVMEVQVVMPEVETETPDLIVDLWPCASIIGVLEVDSIGRIRSVLEERLRPAGLLFGMPTQNLVGSMLGEIVDLPVGRTRPGDLLATGGAKKSSLKAKSAEAGVKVGPVHVLQGSHADGRSLTLDLQAVGRSGPGQPVHIILRMHVSPLMPAAAGASSTFDVPIRELGIRGVEGINLVGAKAAGELGLEAGSSDSKLAASPLLPQKLVDVDATKGPPFTPPILLEGAGKITEQAQQGADVIQARSSMGPFGSVDAAVIIGALLNPTSKAPGGEHDETAAGSGNCCSLPGPSTTAMEKLSVALPLPVVTSARAAALAGRSKLSDRVKARVSGGGNEWGAVQRSASSTLAARFRPAAPSAVNPNSNSSNDSHNGNRRSTLAALGGRSDSRFVPSEANAAPAALLITVDAAGDVDDVDGLATPQLATDRNGGGLDVQSVAESNDSAPVKHKMSFGDGIGRVSTWVASKGAYYQNRIKNNDGDRRSNDGASIDGEAVALPKRKTEDGVTPFYKESVEAVIDTPATLDQTRPREAFSPYQDDDAASEGGQSAMSAQSSMNGAAEYKRGKRYRKLIKLMDSSQTQQVQHRFRVHALATMSALAIVHTICFVLTVVAIQSKRTSMLQLGKSGQSQRFMHQIMTDVRSLDVIVKGIHASHLYKPEDDSLFVRRIASNANAMQARMKAIHDAHQSSDSKVKATLFYTSQRVWDGISEDGSDRWTNITVWDFSTRFFTMAKDIEQNYWEWKKKNVPIAYTTAGQFLLKSGPDLWRASRRVLDALLYTAVEDARWVDNLQLAFLAVEGAVITTAAACYLAILLRALAAQRYKLYETFLVIPVGLTRALASQNTMLLVDEDDEDDEDNMDEEDRVVDNVTDDADETIAGKDAAPVLKQKKRAILSVNEDSSSGLFVSKSQKLLTQRISSSGDYRYSQQAGRETHGGSQTMRLNTFSTEPVKQLGETDRTGFWGRVLRRARNPFGRQGTAVTPLPGYDMPSPAPGNYVNVNGNGGNQLPPAKRKLKYDSHEAAWLLVPFIIWSALVIAIYSTAVVKMMGIVEVLAIHSVTNFMAARTYRAIFYGQELAVVADPALLGPCRDALAAVLKSVKDAWYTIQLGRDAYRAAGPDTERFPLVKAGLAYSSPQLADIVYGSGKCHRTPETQPCPGPEYRFHKIIHTGLDSMMHQFMLNVASMATNTSAIPEGLGDEHFDFVYTVGSKDLLDGTTEIQDAHYKIITALFDRLLVLHVVLFFVFWIIFAGFLLLLLNPLLKRVSRERRRIAELMSQLPLELDVERLVARALGATSTNTAAPVHKGAGPSTRSSTGALGETLIHGKSTCAGEEDGLDTTSKWKAIIRSVTTQSLQARSSASVGGSVHGPSIERQPFAIPAR